MVSHSLGTVRGLKILVSAVRFCPWPYLPSLEIKQLRSLLSPPSSIFASYFAITLLEENSCNNSNPDTSVQRDDTGYGLGAVIVPPQPIELRKTFFATRSLVDETTGRTLGAYIGYLEHG